ncbi:MAG: hypothetical protein ACYSW8_27325 [Planctomycetota bacterium]
MRGEREAGGVVGSVWHGFSPEWEQPGGLLRVVNVRDCWKRQIRLTLQRLNQPRLIFESDGDVDVLPRHCKGGSLTGEFESFFLWDG